MELKYPPFRKLDCCARQYPMRVYRMVGCKMTGVSFDKAEPLGVYANPGILGLSPGVLFQVWKPEDDDDGTWLVTDQEVRAVINYPRRTEQKLKTE